MKSRASLLLAAPALLAAQAPEQGASGGPRATAGNGEAAAYDVVGYAAVGAGEAMTAAHAQLPIGSIAEVTALDSGRIILVQITARLEQGSAGVIALSPAAAEALGMSGPRSGVRVRSIRASASDVAALRAGGAASPRLPAPDALLRGLRHMLPGASADKQAAVPPRKPLATPPPAKGRILPPAVTKQAPPVTTRTPPASKPIAIARGGLLVQVAALRDEQRARALARDLHGRVEEGAGFWRVRLGPFADRVAAQRARDAAISRGYGGASIIPAP